MLLLLAMMAHAADGKWAGTWATAIEPVGKNDLPDNLDLANSSIRQVVKVSTGGREIRLRLSNEFSEKPIEIRSVWVADARDSSDVDRKTARSLYFGGKTAVTIEPGKTVTSDALAYGLKPLQLLAITISYGAVPAKARGHRGSRTTSYVVKGEGGPRRSFNGALRLERWLNIAAVEVRADGKKSIAILGNSITDGRGSDTDRQNRWPDRMAEALAGNALTSGIGVLNLGIGGNCVVAGGLGPTALNRFDTDILGQNGLEAVVVFEGINDICGAQGNCERRAGELIEAYKLFVDKAHKRGIKVYGATITPFGNSFYDAGFFREAARQTVNRWIRTGGAFDGVIDFDMLMRDSECPAKLRRQWQSDWLHPNAEGYEAMGRMAVQFIIDEQTKAEP